MDEGVCLLLILLHFSIVEKLKVISTFDSDYLTSFLFTRLIVRKDSRGE